MALRRDTSVAILLVMLLLSWGTFGVLQPPTLAPRPPILDLSLSRIPRCLVVISDQDTLSNVDTFLQHSTIPKIILTGDLTILREVITKYACFNVLASPGPDCGLLSRLAAQWGPTRARGEGRITLVTRGDQPCVQDFVTSQDLLDVTMVQLSSSSVKTLRYEDLHGKTLNVGVIHYPPFILFPEGSVRGNHDIKLNKELLKLLDGVEYRILLHLSSKFNFSMDITLRQELDLWGMVYQNGTSSGLVGKVKDGLVDVALGGFNWDSRFVSSVDMTQPYRKMLVKFLSPLRESAPNWLSLVQPFKLDMWCAICGVMLAGALTLYLAQWTEDGVADLALSCLISLSVFTQQGDFSQQWVRGVRRPLLLGLQLAMLLLGACYVGLLVSVLTLEPPEQQLDTIQQIATSGLAYTDVDDVWPGQLALSEDPHIRAVLSRLQMSHTWSELGARLRTNRWTYTVECLDTGFLCLQERLDSDLLGRLHLSREFVLTSEIALVLSKGFPLRRAFDREISRLLQSGVPSLWEWRVVVALPDRDMSLAQSLQEAREPSGPVALSLAHLGGPFVLLALGLTLASLTFCCEAIVRRTNLKGTSAEK